ncbi:MAG TPA: HD-GYP domain-containing protein [Actinomycetota bacterium]|jgi:HD-GYP domain-containing protein (c-di-GMP phosphodiesterase class II)
MSVPTSEIEIVRAREFLRTLSAARQVYALYPREHPKRMETTADLTGQIGRLCDARGRPVVLFMSDGNFYMGATLLAWESLTLNRLAQSMAEAGVRSLEFRPGVTQSDADALLRLLMGEKAAENELAWIGVNRATPVVPDADVSGMSELLQSYAAGLELLRQTAARLLAGRPADLDATVRLTEHLAELISEDPAQALLLTTVKSYDEYTYHHMVNVCILSLALARAIGLSHEQSIALGIGGLLHDVGKVKVPREVLQHDGLLNEEQWRLIQRHPVDGAGLVAVTTRDPLHPAMSVVLEHHAAFDGSGYPSLSGRRVASLPSRIVSVADCFDAITSKRSYRKPEERRQALAILQTGAGRSFDPRVVRTFVRLVGLFPVGSLVQLSTGEVGVVVRNHERALGRPTIRLVLDAEGNAADATEIDLSEKVPDGAFRWSVVRTIDPVEMGVDMLSLLASGRLDVPIPRDEGPGLVHEPAPGETPPPGYVDTHSPN